MSEHIQYSVNDGVAVIRLARPEARNAFTLDMVDSWAEHLRDARHDKQVRALVLTGTGEAFCAGGDMGLIGGLDASPMRAKESLTEHIHRVALAMEDLGKPSIAAINGYAVGAGLDMSLMCDIRFMATSAWVSEAYVRLGLVPGDGGAHYLPRIVGVAKAMELLLTGDRVDAEEALRIGLVSRVCADEDLEGEATALAKRFADGPPLAVQMIHRALHRGLGNDLRTNLDLISSHMGLVATSNDAREALTAFREGRSPRFSGN